ncbi:MAG: Smr/MutS family protein [Chitinophagaceae bacterium]|nr:Smr/MutS family protein [Chitinophagaceae bacterium]
MKYQIGDTVLILHSNEEAVVVDIINDTMMQVEVNGIQFPVYMDQVDFPYYKRFTEKKLFPEKKEKQYIDDLRKEKPAEKTKEETGVWLTFLPIITGDEFGDEVVERFRLHLLNSTNTAYHFVYKQHFFGRPDFDLKNTVQPFEDFYLHDVDFEEFNDSPSFEFLFTLVNPDAKKAPEVEALVKLKPKQIFARIKEVLEQNLATFSYPLFAKYPDKVVEDMPPPPPPLDLHKLSSKGFKLYDAKKGHQHMEPARSVIDLHIDKLTDNWQGMSNYEILELQIKTFEKYYYLALHQHLKKFTVVHGIGEGVLKEEIHEILRLKKDVKSFVNQHHPLFGWGATEIYFK